MKTWFTRLAPRERGALVVGSVMIATLIVYAFILAPIDQALAVKRAEVLAQRVLNAWLIGVATETDRLRAKPQRKHAQNSDESLLAVVDRSALDSNLKSAIQRLIPDGDTRLKLWLTPVAFDKVVRWLALLAERYQVEVTALTVSRSASPGLAQIAMTVRRV